MAVKQKFKREVIDDRFVQARTAINSAFAINEYAESVGISVKASSTLICCPFHDDRTPSFSVDFERNIWKCFGCPDGGGFLDFYMRYQDKYQDRKLSKPDAIEDILKQDTSIQELLGFSTIYRSYAEEFTLFKGEDLIDTSLLERKPPQFVDTVSFKHVRDAVMRGTIEQKMEFVADCENGVGYDYLIRKFVYNEFVKTPRIIQNIDELKAEFQDMFTNFED